MERVEFISEETGQLNVCVPVILNVYLDHLYECKKYSELLQFYDEIKFKVPQLVSFKKDRILEEVLIWVSFSAMANYILSNDVLPSKK